MKIYVKASVKGGICYSGKTYQDPTLLWHAIDHGTSPVEGGVAVDIHLKRGVRVVVDASGEVHPCSDGVELWNTLAEIIDNPPAAKEQSLQTVKETAKEKEQAEEDVEEEIKFDNRPSMSLDDMIMNKVAENAVTLGSSLMRGLQGLSFRGGKRPRV